MIKGELDKTLLSLDIPLPDEFTLPDDRIPPPHNQNGDNRCMAYAASGIMTVMSGIYFGKQLEFSEGYIYGRYRSDSDREGNGGMFESQLMPGIVNGGACLFESMPDIKDRTKAFDYVRAHPSLDEEARKYAVMFRGYINLKSTRKADTFENIKKALVKYRLPVWGSMNTKAHAVIFVGYDSKNRLKYRDCNGFEQLFNLDYTKVKEAYLFVMEDKKRFIDVPDYHWGKEAIEYCVGKGYLRGTSEDTFSPDKLLTRVELCQVLMNYDKNSK